MKTLDDYGDTLTVAELAEWRGLSVNRIHALDRIGAFDFARVRPTVGKIAFSRERLRAWVNGELHGLTVSRPRRIAS